jgi:hypothetical protein
MNSPEMMKNLLILVVVIAVLGLAYSVMTGPDQRTASEKVGDAIHELPKGLDKATDELKDDRSPGQKLGDAVRRTGDRIKENSDSQ